LKLAGYLAFLITSKGLDVRRRKPFESLKVEREERSKATQPFDASTLLSIDPELCRRVGFAQGHESFDSAQDREPVERLVEWQMMP
jgi:hypothetical protein